MEKETATQTTDTDKNKKVKGLLKKGGIAVFLFFLLKGIGWLVLLGLVLFGVLDKETVQKIKEAIPFL